MNERMGRLFSVGLSSSDYNCNKVYSFTILHKLFEIPKSKTQLRIGTQIYGYLFIETLFGIKKSKFSNIDFIIPKRNQQ